VSNGLTNGVVISFEVQNANIFAGTAGGGICRSTNMGATWSAANIGLTGTIVFDIASAGPHLFAATEAGILHSADNGNTWSDVSISLGYMYVYALALSSDGLGGQYLLAGTSGGGVWKRPLSEIFTAVPPLAHGLPVQFNLEQNYPNPFNPTTMIRFTLPFGVGTLHATSLRVYDVLGRDVATLVNEMLQPGSYQVPWDGHGMASGVYVYRLQAGSVVATRTMMLVK
jgi:hypothetical protein